MVNRPGPRPGARAEGGAASVCRWQSRWPGFDSQVKGEADPAGPAHEVLPLWRTHLTALLHLKGSDIQAAYQKSFPRGPFPQRAHFYCHYPLPHVCVRALTHTHTHTHTQSSTQTWVGEVMLISWSFPSKGATAETGSGGQRM